MGYRKNNKLENLKKNFELFISISEYVTQLTDLNETLEKILESLEEISGCRHLAIRIIDREGNIPIAVHRGLEKDFLQSENWLTINDCLCGRVARGEINSTLNFFTEFGSFFTNSYSSLKSLYREKELGKTRDICSKKGYESIAIIPIKSKNRIIAEIYLSDEKKNMFPLEKVKFIEKIGSQIGVAINNSILYTELSKSKEKLLNLFNSTSVGIFEIDKEGKILQINATGASLLGFKSPESLVGKRAKMNELFDDKKNFIKLLKKVDGSGKVDNFPILYRKGRKKIFLEFSVAKITDEKGKLSGYQGIFKDITDTLALKEEKQKKARLEKENIVLKEEIKSEFPFDEMVGKSKALEEVKRAIEKVAQTDSTVLIKGETGTGKELVARYIHGLSKRKDRILVKVNCAALSEGLITSELFGHEKGSFTGAIERRIGRFELADKATIFLDEIGDLPPETQAMLLRVLQYGEFERVGSSKTLKVDVRVIAATNRNLEKLVEEKKFRPDLYYRLNVFPIEIPPLRERKEDIPLLVAYFIGKYGKKIGKNIKKISKKTMEIFMNYSWPGNIRELENIIERALIMIEGDTFDLPPQMKASLIAEPAILREGRILPFREFEKQYIIEVLKSTGGKIYGKDGAAEILKIKPSTLQSKMKKLGISRKDII